MFTTGMSDISRVYFSAATAIIGIPTAIKIFSWSLGLSELKVRNYEFQIVLGFVVCFTFGGFTGLLLANQAIDLAYHDTYFVVGHFHFVLSIAAAIAAFLLFVNFVVAVNAISTESFSVSAIVQIGILAVNVLFLVQHFVGTEGHPRRIFLSPEIFSAYHNFANVSIPLLILATQLWFFRSCGSERLALANPVNGK
jgi:heme/copper-type cytochrome/quinol oxidase subunit 1